MNDLLFTGDPATGKTFLAKAAAYYLCHEELDTDALQTRDVYGDLERIEAFVHSDRCEFIQVHPGMTYADIVCGVEIRAGGAMTAGCAHKRVKRLCDRAMLSEERFAVVFDDVDRTDTGALLGDLLYAMGARGESVTLADGSELRVPENVTFIFTQCGAFRTGRTDYALRRRVDRTVELRPDKRVLEKYYGAVNGPAGGIITDIFESVEQYLAASAAPGPAGAARRYMPGHGLFMVDRSGTPYHVLDRFRQKLTYQVFPLLEELSRRGVIRGPVGPFERSLQARLNTGIAGLDRIAGIRKILFNAGEPVEPYSLEDTIDHYDGTIIPDRCSDYKGLLESVIDAVILNGVFPLDLAADALLFNTEVAAVPSKTVPPAYGAYLVKARDAANYYYETSVRDSARRRPHAYYSTLPGSVGRWAGRPDVAAYEISYTDGSPDEVFLPLNGLRLHTFTTNNVCKDNNPAEIYGSLYRLLFHYLKTYGAYIALVRAPDAAWRDLGALIGLERRYLQALNAGLRAVDGPSQTAREKARIDYFGMRIRRLRTLWTKKGERVRVDRRKFERLASGAAAFSADAYEDIYNVTSGEEKFIEIRGVVKMTDLKDYQQIMENIGVRQMVFQGPPGTSKTFESKRFVLRQLRPDAAALTGRSVSQEDISAALDAYKLTESDYADPAASPKLATGGWDLVQFHPSYGYEDFVRGIEVKAEGGMPSYNSVNRILGRIAEFAGMAEKARPDDPPRFYLVIDEINRANIATVFGELIYGLEYRDSRVSTPYEVADRLAGPDARTKDIVLGKNLFIIGTMNTADRSIDSIDYAIRRRFLFIDSPADRGVVLNCYRDVSGNEDENAVELLFFDAVQAIFDNELYFNDEYRKSDVRLGHTYFLRRRQEGCVEDFTERFVFQIVPILREYVKDGILETAEDLRELEHTPAEIRDAADREERVRLLSDDIMLFAKEFGETARSGRPIDNEYIGAFIEQVCALLGY